MHVQSVISSAAVFGEKCARSWNECSLSDAVLSFFFSLFLLLERWLPWSNSKGLLPLSNLWPPGGAWSACSFLYPPALNLLPHSTTRQERFEPDQVWKELSLQPSIFCAEPEYFTALVLAIQPTPWGEAGSTSSGEKGGYQTCGGAALTW